MLQLLHFLQERRIGEARGGKSARLGKLLEPERQRGGPFAAKASGRSLESVCRSLQQLLVAGVERAADLEQPLRAVLDEQLGELAQEVRVAAHHFEQAGLI